MRDLIDQLNKASDAYYNTDHPIMTDAEWDSLFAKLQDLEKSTGVIYSNSPTQNVGAVVLDKLDKVEISPIPMLSLEKVHGLDAVSNFIYDKEVICMAKCDGLSVRLTYQDGKLVAANTRGNGYVGSDITNHVKQFLNVPLTIKATKTYIIDGEAVILSEDFDRINSQDDFKNQRNTASGALNLLDMAEVRNRRLSFVAWDVIEDHDSCSNSLDVLLDNAAKYGFFIVPNIYYKRFRYGMDQIESDHMQIINTCTVYGIPIDGIVWKLDDKKERDSYGRTEHHFNGAIAWKPERELVETHLRGIDWTMGRTGILTPVAIFNPVSIDGSTIERASLHNISVLNKMLDVPYVGQKLWVYKANLIIPQIDHAEHNPTVEIELPETCPICGEKVEVVVSDSGVKSLVCTNESCGGKLVNIIDHFVGKKGLDIRGLSKATIEKLIDAHWITNRLDIFSLKNHKNEWCQMKGFGTKSVSNILNAIEAAKNTTFEKFICSLGIPLIGSHASREISKTFFDYIEFRKSIYDKFDFSSLEGFGSEMSSALLHYDYDEADEIYAYLVVENPNAKAQSNDELKGLKICVTGSVAFGSRNEFKDFIEACGGKLTSDVTKNTNILIANKPETSKKYLTAQKLGIPILTESEFYNQYNLEP